MASKATVDSNSSLPTAKSKKGAPSKAKTVSKIAFTSLCNVDPMLEDIKIQVRCISIWRSHAPNMSHSPWSLDFLVQDEQGNRIQCSVKKNIMHKYEGIIEEGKCYRISNFVVADNSGKFPLLGHMYKIVFYKNTILTRIKDFDENSMGFKFVSIGEINSKQFKDNDVVGNICRVIGWSVVFFYATANMFVSYAFNRENAGHVVLIVQLAKLKYWKGEMAYVIDNVSVSPVMNGTKIFINADLPEVRSFKTSYQKRDGFDESALKIEILSPTKTILTPKTFFKGASRKNVRDIRDSFNEVNCVVYAKIHKIQKEFGWCYPACKQCSRIAKKSWRCDMHGMLKSVTHRYKVIVRVIDHTGSASLILFDNMIQRLLDIPCVNLKEQYDDDDFPTELDILIGKKKLFRFLYSKFNINNNNHVYQVKMISDEKSMIKKFKEGFVYEEDSDKDSDEEYDEDATCVNNADTTVDSTKLSVDIPVANEDDGRNDNANSHLSTTSSFGYQKDPDALRRIITMLEAENLTDEQRVLECKQAIELQRKKTLEHITALKNIQMAENNNNVQAPQVIAAEEANHNAAPEASVVAIYDWMVAEAAATKKRKREAKEEKKAKKRAERKAERKRMKELMKDIKEYRKSKKRKTNEITDSEECSVIKVKIIHLWKTPTKIMNDSSKGETINMLLMDEKGHKIHACANHYVLDLIRPTLKKNNCIIMSNFNLYTKLEGVRLTNHLDEQEVSTLPFCTKVIINENIPAITAFKQRLLDNRMRGRDHRLVDEDDNVDINVNESQSKSITIDDVDLLSGKHEGTCNITVIDISDDEDKVHGLSNCEVRDATIIDLSDIEDELFRVVCWRLSKEKSGSGKFDYSDYESDDEVVCFTRSSRRLSKPRFDIENNICKSDNSEDERDAEYREASIEETKYYVESPESSKDDVSPQFKLGIHHTIGKKCNHEDIVDLHFKYKHSLIVQDDCDESTDNGFNDVSLKNV
ncbi:replication protein A 70 kDa DNA-binding subunit B [Artemisia annua]|uniref:Replication protein A 70 kDa DNA-binding subunit B n=1 Tax=Artemisia annua TaxID=35608 RepID=A0A2U1M5B4_ARTAN|nr:replication protein A 70 kDa DNA-binding subunit B [Artemisia annua]